jgi:hypothetical protein
MILKSYHAILYYETLFIIETGEKLVGENAFLWIFEKSFGFSSQTFCENFCEKTKAKTFVLTLIDAIHSWGTLPYKTVNLGL